MQDKGEEGNEKKCATNECRKKGGRRELEKECNERVQEKEEEGNEKKCATNEFGKKGTRKSTQRMSAGRNSGRREGEKECNERVQKKWGKRGTRK